LAGAVGVAVLPGVGFKSMGEGRRLSEAASVEWSMRARAEGATPMLKGEATNSIADSRRRRGYCLQVRWPSGWWASGDASGGRPLYWWRHVRPRAWERPRARATEWRVGTRECPPNPSQMHKVGLSRAFGDSGVLGHLQLGCFLVAGSLSSRASSS